MNGFSLWVGLGAVLGLWRLSRSVPVQQAGAWVNNGLLVLVASLFGARFFYAAINWAYFSAHPLEVFQIWLGGLEWPGALAGAALAIFCLAYASRARLHRPLGGRRPPVGWIPIGWVADRLSPMLPPVAITAWLGSWTSGIAYGSTLPNRAWWGVPTLDESGMYHWHFPLQPLAALALLVFYWILEARLKPLHPPGKLSGWATFGLLVCLLVVSILRADQTPDWNGFPIDAWFAILYIAFLLSILIANNLLFRIWKRSSYPNSERSSS